MVDMNHLQFFLLFAVRQRVDLLLQMQSAPLRTLIGYKRHVATNLALHLDVPVIIAPESQACT